jgi:coproporphyrinogen III oxidase-like Fe-S oxidoreductase
MDAGGQDWRAGGFGVYVHWPFCLAKCPYCDFNSHVAREVDHDRWRAALVAEMEAVRDLTGPRPAGSMFFGGGTPSLMPAGDRRAR